MFWLEFAENPRSDFKVKFWNKDFTESELRELQDILTRRFYRRPCYLLKELRKVKGLRELWSKAKMGSRILKRSNFI